MRRRERWWCLALVVPVLAAGCLREVVRDDAPTASAPPAAIRGGFDLQAAGIRRVAVIEAVDRTDQAAGLPAAQALLDGLRLAGVAVHDVPLRRASSALASSWLAAQSRMLGVEGFATATVSAFTIQEGRGRAYVAMTAVLVDATGRILWSRRVSAEAPLGDRQAALANGGYLGNNGAALEAAASIAAEEFAHDLAIVPPP